MKSTKKNGMKCVISDDQKEEGQELGPLSSRLRELMNEVLEK